MSSVTFLLPPAAAFGAQRLSPKIATALGRSGLLNSTDAGRRAQLLRHFDVPGGGWPIAALSRQADAGDAGDACWLLVAPAFLRPDINGLRLMAYGRQLDVASVDTDALLPALKPLFGDAGFELDATHDARWYVRCARETVLPVFPDPGDALGDDVFEHSDTSPGARRWRTLLAEAQVVLHHHSWNLARAGRGQLPVNALWPWGGGVLPGARLQTRTTIDAALSNDDTLRAVASGSCEISGLPEGFSEGNGARLLDLHALRDLAVFEQAWLAPALTSLRNALIDDVVLDLEDGRRYRFGRWDRLRVWRRPRVRFEG